MTITHMDITSVPDAVMSHCVIHGNMVYLAGIRASTFPADIRTQTKEVLATIDSYLARAGTKRSNILTAQVWLKDMGLFQEMNEVWNTWVDAESPPSRACVSGELCRPEILVEIMVTALKGGN
ncbi:RidA family protein [Zobellella aerophila]|uniref:RidA family protein n=1 Tax=Zobellella aerophila TaxID=870480 RepID=A0ABP6W4N7_9GAMM